ncbi:MAG: hemolysin III family protein [Elusimicrobiota bacterium]
MHLRPFFGLHEPIASLSHLLAAVAVTAAYYFLYKKGRGDLMRSSALLIFSFTLLFLFTMSGTYHALPPGASRAFFRRLDYAAIWLVIAGSATPVHILLFKGRWRWGLIALFWGCALTCLVVLDVYFARLPYWSIVLGYIGVGSLGVVSFAHIAARYGLKETTLLFFGGLAYTVGAVVDCLGVPVAIPGVLGPHELFHICVMIGAALHWAFIYNWADGREPALLASRVAAIPILVRDG